jgi:hypothetical protein
MAQVNQVALPMQVRGEDTNEFVFRAESANENDRTVELVWSTGARVLRQGRFPDGSGWGPYYEELSTKSKAIDLSRINSGAAPLLDSHWRFQMADQVGVIVEKSVKMNGLELSALAKFRDEKNNKADEIFRSVVDGTVRNVSVGYSVQEYEVTRKEGEIPIFLATRWRPGEVSVVPVGADPDARFRNDRETLTPCEFIERGNDMANQPNNANSEGGQRSEDPNATAETPETRSEPTQDVNVQAPAVSNEQESNQSRNEPTSPAPVVTPAASQSNDVERSAAIVDICNQAGIGDQAAGFIRGDQTVDQVRAHAFSHLADRVDGQQIRGQGIQVGHDNTNPEIIRSRMADAVVARETGAEMADEARQYADYSLLEMGQELVETRGGKFGRIKGARLYEELSVRTQTTADFPLLLQATGDRMLLNAYELTPTTYRLIAKQTSAKDFRAKSLIRAGDFPRLMPVTETGEFQSGALTESAESIKLDTVGRKIMLSREAIINDDLGAFATLTEQAGQAAAFYENETVWGVIINNAKLKSDGKALYNADHKNIIAASPLDAASVGKGKELMRKQVGIDKKRKLNYQPKILAVPAALETAGEQHLSRLLVPNETKNIVPESQRRLELVVEPLLDDASETAWHLFTDPDLLAAVIFCYLEGQTGPMIRMKEFGFMGAQTEVALDFAAEPLDYRATVKNPGQ